MSVQEINPATIELTYRNSAHGHLAKGFNSRYHYLKHMSLKPYKIAMMVWTFINLKLFPSYPITEQSPRIQYWFEKIAHLCGLNPSYPWITELHLPTRKFHSFKLPFTNFHISYPVIVDTDHVVKNELINKKILDQHRNVNFDGSNSFDAFYNFLKKVFPNTAFNHEDAIFTCGPDFTSQARNSIIQALHEVNLNEVIQDQGEKFIDRWKGYAENNISFDLTSESQLFTAGVITQALLGKSESSDELSQAIHFMNGYLFARATLIIKKKGEDEKFQEACKIFRDAVDEILVLDESKALPLFKRDKKTGLEYTPAQKQAQILSVFFAGQETTAFGLDKLFAKLALNPKDQAMLLEAIQAAGENFDPLKIPALSHYIYKSLLEDPPVNGIGRRLGVDTILSFTTLKEEKRISKFMRKGEILIPQIVSVSRQLLKQKENESKNEVLTCGKNMAKEMNKTCENNDKYETLISRASIFGNGKHVCPGKSLALKELSYLVAMVMSLFKISPIETQFTYTPKLTNQANTFFVNLIKT